MTRQAALAKRKLVMDGKESEEGDSRLRKTPIAKSILGVMTARPLCPAQANLVTAGRGQGRFQRRQAPSPVAACVPSPRH